jgi:peptidoglycan glycosyltransferase
MTSDTSGDGLPSDGVIHVARAAKPRPRTRTTPTAAPVVPARRPGARLWPGGGPPAPERARLFGLAGALAVVVLAVVLLLRPGGDSPGRTLAQQFVGSWARGDYAQMYTQVDDATRQRLPVTAFAAAYRAALATSTATGAVIGRAQATAGGTVTVPVTVYTRLWGRIATRFVLPIVGSGAKLRVLWRPWLTFPGVRAGETLTRQTAVAARARLLARDGTPLANLVSASGIVGAVGPIPTDRATVLRDAGYPADAMVGISGLERTFDIQLGGRPGGQLYAGSRLIASAAPVAGKPVRTSISPSLQSLAQTNLGGMEGGVVLLVPSTGEILAAAGTPFSELQPPGSTFKLVTLTGVLLAGLANPTTTFPYETYTYIDGYKLQNANGESCGGTLANAFAVSCNSVFAPLGVKLGGARLVDAATRYGFNQPSPIPSVSESTIPPPDSIGSALDIGSSAIGQGQVQATTLQMALVGATIANGGRRPVPTLAFGVRHPAPAVVPLAVARTVRLLMIGVVNHGTGMAAQIPGVVVAGKTGTAELATTATSCTPDPNNPGACPGAVPNDPKNTDAWFVAFAPAGAPRVAVGVLLAHDGAGGDTAAPVARVMLEAGLKATAGVRRPAATAAPPGRPAPAPAKP